MKILEQIKEQQDEFIKNSSTPENASSRRRARKNTIKLGVLYKQYRKESI